MRPRGDVWPDTAASTGLRKKVRAFGVSNENLLGIIGLQAVR